MRTLFRLLASAGYIGFGAVHALWIAKGLIIRSCGDPSVSCTLIMGDLNRYWDYVWYVGAVPAFIGSAILAGLVLFGKTSYPRWTILFNPAFLYGASLLAMYTPAPLGSPLVGIADNLGLPIFFLVSLATTWNFRPEFNALETHGSGS